MGRKTCSRHAAFVIFVNLLLVAWTRSQQAPSKADMVMGCFTNRSCFAHRTTWNHLTGDVPSCLTAARVWWSAAPPRIPVTLITQLTVERLDNLRAQCAFWQGPLAAVVYVPLVSALGDALDTDSQRELQQTISVVGKLFEAAEAHAALPPNTAASSASGPPNGCQLRLLLVYEVFAGLGGLNLLYPVNSLRNYARLLADTDLITNIDVDMLPSTSISTVLADAALLAEYTAGCRAGGAYIWPAFEARCGGTSFADTVAMGDRTGVPEALKTCLRTMRPQAPFSHNATNFKRWLSVIQGGLPVTNVSLQHAYRTNYTLMFEPWFLSWRWGTQWYDYRYRGYGYNKIAQVASMNAAGTAWFVSPHGFLVHRPHKDSAARKDFLRSKLKGKDNPELRSNMYEHVEMLWAASQREIQAKSYIPLVEPEFEACMDLLPWWRAEDKVAV